MRRPASARCSDERLIGVGNSEAQEVEDGKKERNDRILAVVAASHVYGDVETPEDLPDAFVDNLTQFWINKDRLEGKSFTVLGVLPDRAWRSISFEARPRRSRRLGAKRLRLW